MYFTAPSAVQCQVCGKDGLCNGFDDNGEVEDCPVDHACFYVTESKCLPYLIALTNIPYEM